MSNRRVAHQLPANFRFKISAPKVGPALAVAAISRVQAVSSRLAEGGEEVSYFRQEYVRTARSNINRWKLFICRFLKQLIIRFCRWDINKCFLFILYKIMVIN